jgi:fermentation-respiration switch protein FrsA (DUF1100 family)
MSIAILFATVGGTGGPASLPAQEDTGTGSVVGAWQGTLDAAGTELRLVFHVEHDADGRLVGSLDSPDQGAFGIRLSAVEVDSTAVRFAVASLGGEYSGRPTRDGEAIEGHWSQGGARFPLDLARTEEAPLAPERPQEPEPPYPYTSLDVVFDNPDAGIRLAGTLTIPSGDGPHPAVALISGSGPQDRDEAVFGHRPFLVLADHLTRRGIAVLRTDDRGVGESTGDFAAATTLDFASDALAAVALLASRPEVDPERIGLIGHSEGALVVPMVANRSADVAFAVLLASSGVSGEELLTMQLIAINRAQGMSESVTEARSALQKRLLDVVASTADDSSAAVEARRILEQAGVTGEPAEAQVRALLTPWMRYFLTYDPLPALRELAVPVLVLAGEKDTQVPPTENLGPADRALREGGNPDVTTEVLPGLNHLFQTADTGSPAEYARIEETFAPRALATIADWIADRTARP